MFTSLGCFAHKICVYYASGLCMRPNCFYHHPAKLQRVGVNDNSDRSSLYKYNKTILNKESVVKTLVGNIKAAEVSHKDYQIKKDNEYEPVQQSSTSRSQNKYAKRETQQIPATIEKNKRPYNRVEDDNITDSVDGIEKKKFLAVDVAKHLENSERPFNRVNDDVAIGSVDGIENKKCLAVDVVKHLENPESPCNNKPSSSAITTTAKIMDIINEAHKDDVKQETKTNPAIDVTEIIEVCDSDFSSPVISNTKDIAAADRKDDAKTIVAKTKQWLGQLEDKGDINQREMEKEPASATSKTFKNEDQSKIKTSNSPKGKDRNVVPLTITFESTRKSKIAINIRQKMLERIHKEYCQMYRNTVATKKAVACEEEVAMRSNMKQVYLASVSSVIGGIRRRVKEFKQNQKMANTVKTEAPSTAESDGIFEQELLHLSSQPNLYSTLVSLALSPDDLMRFGYPISPTGGQCGRAICYKLVDGHSVQIGNGAVDSDIRKCDRCKTTYRVTEDGNPVRSEKCLYHYGHRLESVEKGESGSWYTCCNGDSGSEGCTDAPTHVSDDPENIDFSKGFVRPENIESSWSVIAMDCSMVYTKVGKELAKITIVNHKKEILFEKLVMPRNPILDYNTRCSGITEELIVQGPTISVEDVQTFLLINLSPNSIIIGHNLESALQAVKLIHTKVVDTSILYSDVKGSKIKQSLESLSQEFCKRIIRSFSSTYNTYDNAISALELAIMKANEILNKRESSIKNKQNSKDISTLGC